MEVQETGVQTDRLFTIPNLLSFTRLLGVPLFLWLVLVPEADGWAFVVLAVSAFTDYLDGKLARRWNQISRVGQLLDPLADRLYVLSTVVALTIREIIPLWFAVLLVGCVLPVPPASVAGCLPPPLPCSPWPFWLLLRGSRRLA